MRLHLSSDDGAQRLPYLSGSCALNHEGPSRGGSVLREALVGIAIQPAFARLRRRDYRVPRLLCMARGVPIGRVVAAVRAAAVLARAQVHPLAATLHAFVAFELLRVLDVRHRGEMRAALIGHAPPRGKGRTIRPFLSIMSSCPNCWRCTPPIRPAPRR